MSRLVLHIGAHKTGSTSLQAALLRAQKDRRLQTWTYLSPENGRAAFIMLVKVEGQGATFSATVNLRRLRSLLPDGPQDCILSSETYFWLEDPEELAKLAGVLRRRFSEIRIVAYLRRQDLLALSHRKQVIEGHAAARFYGLDVAALPRLQPHFHGYFDYARKLALWEEAFGPGSVTVRRFQSADLVSGDVVPDFFSLLDVPPPGLRRKHNTAFNRRQILAGLWLRQQGHAAADVMPLLKKMRKDAALSPSRSEAEAFVAPFADSNRQLAARYDPAGPAGFFDPDMSRYPDAGNDGLDDLAADLAALSARLASA